MINAEIHELNEFLRSASRQIAEEYDRIQKRVKEDPGTAGDQGEENWASLLRNWLPHTFHIVTKGRILGYNGSVSPQIDILVLRPEYPPSLLDKKLYLAGGVLAAFECKITLKASHIRDFIKSATIVKSELPHEFGSPYKELQTPMVYGLLAHSHSWKHAGSTPIENIEKIIWQADIDFVKHPIQMPDIICIADLAVWSTGKLVYFDEMDCSLPTVPEYSSTGCTSSSYGLCSARFDESNAFLPIGEMMRSLLHKIAWEVPGLRPLVEYFDSAGSYGIWDGTKRRMWKSSIFSPIIRNEIPIKVKDIHEGWDEWGNALH
ncbi:MAG: hypothetical protein E6Q24_16600 [Chitinophagaceae bacterium]|nr:MAG: hypothetical protein E6Q24_16600 [Chitinophagaceae bacterium]